MKTHTQTFKDNVCLFGRELNSKITYTLNNNEIELGAEELNSITPHYEGGILKSVMRQLDIDSNENIPLGTIVNYQFGIKTGEDLETGNNVYEYINYGNYIVYSSEKQEDTGSYKIVCYDKMLYSMVDYETPKISGVEITYPISVRDYIRAICVHLGLTFKNANWPFANYNRQINSELYLNAGYTFRSVLDELAQVTASTICINEDDDELEIRYIEDTEDTIDGEYLKDVNVNFGKKYGPINSVVLSRAGGSDNVYLKDDESIAINGLCEIKISDNQIMNFNDRSDYLPDILDELDGLEYYINDFSSTGICYYNLCDRYNVQIDNNTYSCVMFNDEVDVTQGLEEQIHTDMPDESETEYKYADKTDRKINQTYLIVDKQNQEISAVVSQTIDPNNPDSMKNTVTQLNVRVGVLESAIGDIADITTSAEDTDGQVELENVNESEPIQIKIHPIGENIGYDYPHDDYPQNDYSKVRTLMFTRTYIEDGVTKTENIPYELPDDLLYYDSEHYDEFYLDYDSQTCQITKKCKYNIDGSVGLLSSEQIVPITPYPTINLGAGNYTIILLGYNNAYLMARLMAQNIYTTQFYTKAETNSLISQTERSIDLSVDEKLTRYDTTDDINAKLSLKVGINDNNQVVSMINASANDINITGNRISITSDNFSLNNDGEIEATKGKIANMEMKDNEFYLPITVEYEYTSSDIDRLRGIILGTITPTQEDYNKYDFDGSGTFTLEDLIMVRNIIISGITPDSPGKITFIADGSNSRIEISGGSNTITSQITFYEMMIQDSEGSRTTIQPGQIRLEDENGNSKTITATN